MKTRKEIVNPEGVTLGQLTDFVAACNAAEIPASTVPDGRKVSCPPEAGE
jgi:hypothetical protein